MTTARQDPVGLMIENGYQSLIAFKADPDIGLWEKTVQPLGMEGGEKVDITTMHNTTVKTYGAQALKEATDAQMTVGYDPASLADIIALINVSDEITIHFPDGSTWDMYGYLRNFQPNALENGVHPEATCVIVATNVDPSDGSEYVPVYTAPPTP